jgi:hypothetical protein
MTVRSGRLLKKKLMMVKQGSSVLKLTTKITDTNQSFYISFPQSRNARTTTDMGEIKHLQGFHKRLQNEYNMCPVGKYAGPYDQSEKLKLKIQLRKSNLDYEGYSQFFHEKDIACREYCVKDDYENIDDLWTYLIRMERKTLTKIGLFILASIKV